MGKRRLLPLLPLLSLLSLMSLIRCLLAWTGLGADGWQGVLAKWAPEWMQERYRLGAIGGAVNLDFPGECLTHHVKMIPKAGRDPALFSPTSFARAQFSSKQVGNL